jgi:hypothetical protein
MYSLDMFSLDRERRRIVAMAAELGAVNGEAAVFEHIEDETFGLKIKWDRVKPPAVYKIVEQVQSDQYLTHVLEPTLVTRLNYPSVCDYKLIVVSRIHSGGHHVDA